MATGRPQADQDNTSSGKEGSLAERMRLAGAILLDGATGTELERRDFAADLPLWSSHALLDALEAVAAIHADYVAAGVDLIDSPFPDARRNDCDPLAFAEQANHWIEAGAVVIGGCCGTTPAHIRALREAHPRVSS